MENKQVKCRIIYKGNIEGELLATSQPISFYGGVDPDTGIITEKGHELEGKCIAGKILAFPRGKGSTVGSYALYRLKKNGKAPMAMINLEAETIVAVGAIISKIPMVDKIPKEVFHKLKNGMNVKITDNGEIAW